MYSSIPYDVELCFLRGAHFLDVVSYSHLCRQARLVVQGKLTFQCNILLTEYMDFDDIEQFWTALNIGRGGVCGSGALWLTEDMPDWGPGDLNTVVVGGLGGTVRQFLRDKGWSEERGTSRIPHVAPARPPTHLISTGAADGPYADTFWRYTKTGKPLITVTETADECVFKHIAGAKHTMGTMLLTSTALIALHAYECANRYGTWRAGAHFPDWERAQASYRLGGMNGHSDYFTARQSPCGSLCPGILRRLRGGRGVGLLAWRSERAATDAGHEEPASDEEGDLVDAVDDAAVDRVRADAYGGFRSTAYAFGWSWCSCTIEACETFMFPRDIFPTVAAHIRLSTNPKEDRILRMTDAVENCWPPFPRLFTGILFPTSCSRPYIVPVPLDHGMQDFRTMDDVRAHTWITPRIPGLPALPVFMPPHAVVGSTCVFSPLGWRENYAQGRSLLIFMSSIHEVGPRNTVLDVSSPRPVHGDVLLMLEENGMPRNVDMADIPQLKSLFSQVWGSKNADSGVGNFYVTSFDMSMDAGPLVEEES
ncbi:hypothetical protein DFH06DRAFT_1331547 [Mycena polygramma]|nr:hypothetical protein DFH06DRAFT_1331547 [Mycena polygramma]